MDPVEHRIVKQACLILTAEPLKAFLVVPQYTNAWRILKKLLQVRTSRAVMILLLLSAAGRRRIRRRGLLCGFRAGLSRFIHLSTKPHRTSTQEDEQDRDQPDSLFFDT